MGHVTVFGDDLETLDGFSVANNVVEEDWAVLLDPDEALLGLYMLHMRDGIKYHGNS